MTHNSIFASIHPKQDLTNIHKTKNHPSYQVFASKEFKKWRASLYLVCFDKSIWPYKSLDVHGCDAKIKRQKTQRCQCFAQLAPLQEMRTFCAFGMPLSICLALACIRHLECALAYIRCAFYNYGHAQTTQPIRRILCMYNMLPKPCIFSEPYCAAG